MIQQLKSRLYFPIASYFRFWARGPLRRWHPRVILITGSSGKTTILHLLEAQLGQQAIYSHHANSAMGIPFHLLGLDPKHRSKLEWFWLVGLAPIKSLRRPPKQSIYVVEADSDRPGELAFTAGLVKPELAIWLSSDKSHTYNFGPASGVEAAVAQEFGGALAATTKQVIINADAKLIMAQTNRTKAKLELLHSASIKNYTLKDNQTSFTIDGQTYTLPALEPEVVGMSVAAVIKVCSYLGINPDKKFTNFQLPPGRSSLFNGAKGSRLIDSSYNNIPDAARAMLKLFAKYPAKHKWLVMGDMLELGSVEASEHVRLAKEIADVNLERIILVGPRVSKYTAPRLAELKAASTEIVSFTKPRPALDYLKKEITGEEIIMLKGARFFEGIVEHLLLNPADTSKLCRREAVWQRRRERWGL